MFDDSVDMVGAICRLAHFTSTRAVDNAFPVERVRRGLKTFSFVWKRVMPTSVKYPCLRKLVVKLRDIPSVPWGIPRHGRYKDCYGTFVRTLRGRPV